MSDRHLQLVHSAAGPTPGYEPVVAPDREADLTLARLVTVLRRNHVDEPDIEAVLRAFNYGSGKPGGAA